MSDHIMLEVQSEGRTVGFRESERGGRAASADDHGSGRISLELTGTSPQGEEDTLETCRVLVRTLNRIGEAWNEPALSADDADCIATHAIDPSAEPLRIQVVRAIVDPNLWQTLSTSGKLTKSNAAIEEMSDLMAQALLKKLDPSRIPPKQRASLVLVLDANRLPGLAFDSVLENFRERHGATLGVTGFRSVWIVGPTESLTKRIDLGPNANTVKTIP